MKLRIVAVVPTCLLAMSFPLLAQETSVRPGINDPFRKPDVKAYIERFEGESREIFEKRDAIVQACALKLGMRVADVGAGTGLFTRMFAREVGPRGQVMAVDIAPAFLEHIDKTSRDLKLNNVKTILGSDASPRLPAGSADLVFVCDTYHHFEYPKTMLKDIHAALKPGGRLVVIDFIRTPGTSRQWVIDHVRAGQDVFEREITESGFKKMCESKGILKENYLTVFEKAGP
jgi:predicted methyltransferase